MFFYYDYYYYDQKNRGNLLVSAGQEVDLQGKLGIRSALKLLEVETVLLDRFHVNVKRFTVKASSIVCCRAARSAAT